MLFDNTSSKLQCFPLLLCPIFYVGLGLSVLPVVEDRILLVVLQRSELAVTSADCVPRPAVLLQDSLRPVAEVALAITLLTL